jgi:leukotriene-A4 hydrolase
MITRPKKLEHNPNDISTYSNFDKILQKSLYIEVTLDFKTKTLYGEITSTYKYIDKTEKYLILDLKGPKIQNIYNIQRNQKYPLKYEIIENLPDKNALGTPLKIALPLFGKTKPNEIKIKIEFITNENCTAIQFLNKEQTHSKKYPFMFTQCEPIQCRSLFPCQDTPSAKVNVTVKTYIDKPYLMLFSGIPKSIYWDANKQKNVIVYKQQIIIPTYLIAFAAGKIAYEKISERCGVYAEEEIIEKSKNEFKNAELYLSKAEEYLNRKYDWGTYNLLVLPFSFPYGGMENPNLTFVTPSLLAGDGSLSYVIGHEISHSWTGNLVTNKNWENFWVNEGFTTFMERKLDGMIYGEDMESLESIVGLNDLIRDIEMFGENNNYTQLMPNYENVDPDDGFCSVPYEKGFQFLIYLESLVGKDAFQNIMQEYIKKYAFQSVDYNAFKEVYENYVIDNTEGDDGKNILNDIDWDSWLYSKGKPFADFHFSSSLEDDAIQLAEKYFSKKGNFAGDYELFKNWHTNVKVYFLNYVLNNINKVDDKVYKLIRDNLKMNDDDYNMEVKNLWYQIGIKSKHDDVIPGMKKLLTSIGRMKYLKPLYSTWYEFNKKDAKSFFDKNKNLYHPVAQKNVGSVFK